MALGAATNSSVPTHLISNGAPAAGTDAVQTITPSGTVTSGTFRLSFEGFSTLPIAWDATTAIAETILNTLPSLGDGGTGLVGVVVTGGPLGTALTVTFSGSNVAKKAHGLFTLYRNDLVGGGTIVIAHGTPGVDAFGRGAAPGAQALDGQTGTVYYNSGTSSTPVWSVAS